MIRDLVRRAAHAALRKLDARREQAEPERDDDERRADLTEYEIARLRHLVGELIAKLVYEQEAHGHTHGVLATTRIYGHAESAELRRVQKTCSGLMAENEAHRLTVSRQHVALCDLTAENEVLKVPPAVYVGTRHGTPMGTAVVAVVLEYDHPNDEAALAAAMEQTQPGGMADYVMVTKWRDGKPGYTWLRDTEDGNWAPRNAF